MRWLLLLLVPVVDVYLLIRAGQTWGGLWVAAFVVASALVGRWLARRNARRLLALFSGARPGPALPGGGQSADLVSGGLLGLAGVLLMIPGPVSSGLGLALIAPPARRWVARFFTAWVERRMAALSAAAMAPGMRVDLGGPGTPWREEPPPGPRGPVIDVESVEVRADRKPS